MSFLNIINPRAHPKARSLSLMDDLPAQPILEAPSRPNSPSLTHIYDLPKELIINILRRLYSDDLACCRFVSKTFFDISTEFRSINLLCPLDRYTNSGQPITPFKEIVTDLILSMGDVDYISIGVEERANHKSLDVKLDNLHLTEVSFVYRWLKRVCGGLTSLSISDYRMHSRRKWSEVLSLISFHCKNLHELVLKNAWLSTNGLSSPMLMLASLTLECVRLDDEDLHKVNSCCPSLQILNLILVEGLEGPRIDLLHLRTCQFVGSGGLPLIHAPNLTRFEVGLGMRIDKIVCCELDLSYVNLLAPVSPVSILNMLSEQWLKDVKGSLKDVNGSLKDVKGVKYVKGVKNVKGLLKDVKDLVGRLKDVQGQLKDVEGRLKYVKWWQKDVEERSYVKGRLKHVKGLRNLVEGLLKDVKWQKNLVEGLLKDVQGKCQKMSKGRTFVSYTNCRI